MDTYNLPAPDSRGIIRILPKDLSEENRKRISKFGTFMFMYDLIQDHWVRPRIHKASPIRHREFMQKVITPLRENAVLDIACGTGGAIPLFDTSIDYTGLDLSYAMLSQAIKKAENKGFRRHTFIEGNAEKLIFPGESFDFILIDTSLHMIPRYRDCIGEASRTLKKDGQLFCSCPTVGINRKFDDLWAKIAPKRNLNALKESDLQAVCSQSGLTYDCIGTNGGVLYFRSYKTNTT